jgi:hypothetical protein
MEPRGRVQFRSKPVQPKAGTGISSGDPPSITEPPPEIPEWLEEVRLAVEREAPILRTLLVRGIHAVLRFTALSESAIANATAAPTDLAVLLRALSSTELLDDLRAADPLAPAFIRGIEASRRLIDDHGGALTAVQVAQTLGISRQMVEKRRRAGKLLAVSTGRHGYRYPVWQFDESGVLPGFEDVLTALSPHDEWMKVAFFVSKNERLGDRTPIESLKSGELDVVLDAAVVHGEHGAE